MKIYPSLEQDYPSLADINYQLEQTDTTLIFGTPSKVLSLYQQMVDEPNLFRRAVAKDIGTDGVFYLLISINIINLNALIKVLLWELLLLTSMRRSVI